MRKIIVISMITLDEVMQKVLEMKKLNIEELEYA